VLATAMIATSSLPMCIAYAPPQRRIRAGRPITPSSITVEKFYSTNFLQRLISSDVDPSHTQVVDVLSYRQVRFEDIPDCCRIATISSQDDDTTTVDNLRYMQHHAGEYFWCAYLPVDKDNDECNKDIIVGYISSSRCTDFTEECISNHDPKGSILAIHSVVVDPKYQYQDIAISMMQNYMRQIIPLSRLLEESGYQSVNLLARSDMLSCYVDVGFRVLRPSPIRNEQKYELEARQDVIESMVRTFSPAHPLSAISRSTSNPDEGAGNLFANGRDRRRAKLHSELSKLGIDPHELENHQERFGTAAIRTYNSFLLPKSVGALAVAESPTRPRVVANNISFLVKEFNADQERWLRNVDQIRRGKDELVGAMAENDKHPITIILDNIRSAHNVGNILRLAEAAQINSVRLCGMTPRPPHPKV
jgi:hypothetical protein